jgi:ligand-binding sensor domain-containing protein/signal transduction histidine kinase
MALSHDPEISENLISLQNRVYAYISSNNRQVKPKIILKKHFWLTALYLFFSCTQKPPAQQDIPEKKDTLKPPVTQMAKNPVVVYLDTCPPPHTVNIPIKTGGSHFVKNWGGVQIKVPLTPPKTYTPTFFLSMQNYNTENGLASNIVRCSYCDRKGNLWFGTGEGISRYDGKSFMNFSNYGVISIIEDKSGNFWFGTFGGGISRYDGNAFINLTTKQGLANDYVNSIFEDKNGDIWFATNGGASRLDHDKINLSAGNIFTNFTTSNGLASNNITGITEDRKGNLWFATIDKGVSSYNGKSFSNLTTKQGLANNSVYSLLTAKDGNLWFGTDGGVSRYDGKSFTNYDTSRGIISQFIWSIFEDKNGDLWFSTTGQGVSRLDYNKKTFTNYNAKQGLFNDATWNITSDKSGNLWFSSYGGGVARLNNKITYSNNVMSSIIESSDGNLWFGSEGGGSFHFDINKKSDVNYSTYQGLMENHVLAIMEDKKGNTWFGTFGGGVSQLDKNKKVLTTYSSAQGLVNDTVTRIYEDKNGDLWFGTFGGLSKLDINKKKIYNCTKGQGLAGDYISGILRDENANLWICTNEGISKFDDNTFTNYTTRQGLKSDNVTDMLEDKKGNFWFATNGGGLSRLDKELNTFSTYTTEQGLGDDNVTDIAMDAEGTIWLGTTRGFTALRGFTRNSQGDSDKTLISTSNELSNKELENGGYKPVFEIYNSNTGYPVNDIRAMCITHDDIIWAASSAKIFRFDHNAIHKNNNPPIIFIQSIRVNNENVCWQDLKKNKENTDSSLTPANIIEEIMLFGKPLKEPMRDSIREKYSGVKFDSITAFYPVPLNLELPYMQNNITFEFAAIEPANPNQVKYQYTLQGYDHGWNPVSNKTSASFGNISEGSYTFILKAQSPDGVWSEALTYTFQVLPPWYRSWWAYSLYVILFAAALWRFITWRTKILEKEKTLLEEKITARTIELREEKEKVENTLSELKTTQAQLIQAEKMASLGELTAGIAHEIQNPLNFVNNFSEVNTELITEMKDEIEKGNIEEVKALADDIQENEQKINHHGKRADAIVKGMLQHSRTPTGQKELTDINTMAEEFFRLSYHGQRANDKFFNVTMEKDFDPGIGKINIVPQDIGRVLLNLFNNAFYSVNEKKKLLMDAFEPVVSLSTKRVNNNAILTVKDNGNGIPQKVLSKIFQPFFSTKPTGQGTGLGLSLSYDIVKAHGGEIKVETKENEAAAFQIILPIG